ncbi:MAG: hypothetical protein EA370_15450, partial [Wenzhouxiangella sp.]
MHAVFSWELGAGYGHVQPILALGRRLRAAGGRISCLLPDRRFEELLRTSLDAGVHILPKLPEPDPSARPVSWPDLLRAHGYADASALTSRVQVVREALQALAPDLILMEHAPLSLLASRGLDAVRILHGTGFTLPPSQSPMPVFRLDGEQRASAAESQLLSAANQALQAIDQPELEQLSDMLAVDQAFLCTLPMLDHYEERADADYCGPLLVAQNHPAQTWPGGGATRVICYLKGHWPGLNALISALGELPVRALVHIDGERAGSYLAPDNVRVCPTPLDFPTLLKAADLVIHHAGHTLACQALLAGTPQWCVPLHAEQEITARRLNQIGCGHFYSGAGSLARLRKVLA